MIKLMLQLFAESDHEIVEVDVEDDGEEETPGGQNPGGGALPVAVINTNQQPNPQMPSGLAAEAWRNVEELMVTMSNSVRVKMSDVMDNVNSLKSETVEAINELRSSVGRLETLMAEFTVLMQNATVEVPEQKDDDQKPQPKRGGYAASRFRK